MAEAAFDPEDYDLDSDLVPCEFCSKLFPIYLLIEHSSGCRPDLCAAVKGGESSDDDYDYHPAKESDDLDPLVKSVDVNLKVEKNKKEDNAKSESLGNLLPKTANPSPIKIPNNQVFNIVTKDVGDAKPSVKSNILQKNSSPVTLNVTKPDHNKGDVGPSSSKTIQNDFNEAVMPKDEEVSSDDDDNYETIENFWRRAAIVLKNRLADKGDSKLPIKFNFADKNEVTKRKPIRYNMNTF